MNLHCQGVRIVLWAVILLISGMGRIQGQSLPARETMYGESLRTSDEFTTMTAAEKKNLETGQTENLIYLHGFSESKPRTVFKLTHGEWLGWDEVGFGLNIHISKAGAEISRFELDNPLNFFGKR